MPTVQIDELDVDKVMKYLEELDYAKYNDISSNVSYGCDSCDYYALNKNYDKKSTKSRSNNSSHQAYKDVQYKNNTIGCCSEKSYSKYGRSNKYSKTTPGKSRSRQAYKGADYTYNDCCSVKGCTVGKGARSTSGKSNQGYGDADYVYNEMDCCSGKGSPCYSTTSIDKTKASISRSRAGSTRSNNSTKSDKSDQWQQQPIIRLMPDDVERITTKKKKRCNYPCLFIIIIILVLLLLGAITALIVILANANFGKCDCNDVTAPAPAPKLPALPPPPPPTPTPESCPTPKSQIVWPTPEPGETTVRTADKHGILVYPEGRTERYLVVNEAVAWEVALRRCQEKGGHLAVLESLEELEKLSDELSRIPPMSAGGNSYNYYLGGIKLHNEGPFFWVTSGDQVNELMWAKGEPNHSEGEEFCVGLDPFRQKGKINDTKCIHGYIHLEGFVCELPYY